MHFYFAKKPLIVSSKVLALKDIYLIENMRWWVLHCAKDDLNFLVWKNFFFFQIELLTKNSKIILAMLLIILCLSRPSEPRYLNYRSRTSFTRSLKQWLNVKSIIFQNNVDKPANPNSFGSNPANLTSGLTSYQIANLNAW